MNNSIKASISFYFKGELLKPSATIDLDVYLKSNPDLSFIYNVLAKSIGMDSYRHEYDVLLMEDIVYSEPTGIVVDFVCDGKLDWAGLEQVWRDAVDLEALTPIANKIFNVENLKDDPKLAAALLAAYRQGQQTSDATAAINKGLNEGFYG